MATSTCVKCGNSSFEMVWHTPKGSAFKLMLVQCSMCGGVVNAMDGYNIGQKLREQDEALRKIAARVGAVINIPD